jgi:Fe-S-cluster-containing dehydrogenase component
MTNYGWLFDSKRCIECRACEAACKQWNGVPTGVGVRYRSVRTFEQGVFPQIRTQALSMSCNHCQNAPCVKVCPLKAIWRRGDGIIRIKEDLCAGCGFCSQFCPYDGLTLNPVSRKMQKCGMCAERIDSGLQPACVSVCPTKALKWGPWDEISGLGADRVENFTMPWTSPAIRFVTEPWRNS